MRKLLLKSGRRNRKRYRRGKPGAELLGTVAPCCGAALLRMAFTDGGAWGGIIADLRSSHCLSPTED